MLVSVWLGAAWLLQRMDPYPPTDPTLSAASAALGGNTRMVVMGTSHVLHGINPAALDPGAMNIALNGADYETLSLILRRRLSDLPNLRLVILEADNLCLFNTGLARRDFSAVYQWGLSRDDLPLPSAARFRQAVSEHPLVAAFLFSRRLTPRAWNRAPPMERVFVGPGFQVYTGRVSTINDGPDRIRAHEQTVSEFSARRNLKALRELLAVLKERGIQVVLLTLPHHNGYTANATPRWNRLFRDLIEEASLGLGSGMVWWNFDQDPDFTDDDFNDGHHLNARGAEKFTRMLRTRLLDIRLLPGE